MIRAMGNRINGPSCSDWQSPVDVDDDGIAQASMLDPIELIFERI